MTILDTYILAVLSGILVGRGGGRRGGLYAITNMMINLAEIIVWSGYVLG